MLKAEDVIADTVYLNVLQTGGTCSPALLIVFSQVVTLRIICFLKVTIDLGNSHVISLAYLSTLDHKDPSKTVVSS